MSVPIYVQDERAVYSARYDKNYRMFFVIAKLADNLTLPEATAAYGTVQYWATRACR